MSNRPDISRKMDENTFRSFYYLKEELVEFCKSNRLPTSGGKIEITDRIAAFLENRKIKPVNSIRKDKVNIETINENSKIESNFVCSEMHRAFFAEKIGKTFSFNVVFQKWLKENTGKTYAQAINAYYQILSEKKNRKKQ